MTSGADGANSVFATDLDGDGDADVLSASRLDDRVVWYENFSEIDATAPAPVDGLTALDGHSSARVTWTNPSDIDLSSVELTWVRADAPETIDFTNEVTSPAVDGDGEYTRTNTPLGEYIVTVTAVDGHGNVSAARRVRVTMQTYSVGDPGPAGGIIFYDDESDGEDKIAGARYLEAAPSGTEWSNKGWGGFGTLVGGTDWGIGTGEANTTTIVSALGTGNYAARLCYDLVHAGYDDWFLPSYGELNLMYENLHDRVPALGGFTTDSYWSSKEATSQYAYEQSFVNGHNDTPAAKNKTDSPTRRVRAVRSF